jgi:predicted enzyme related to lactoylglutathione lyase
MMKLMRVIVFTNEMEKLTQFYGDQLGLKAKPDPNGDSSEWIEFNGGGAGVALHKAHGGGGTCAHKLVFYAKDVAKARATLLKKKVKLGEVKRFGKLVMCDGIDPAGNRIQISNRK